MEILKKTILQAVTTGNTQGNWNANLNTPDITTTTEIGYMWYVSVSGKTVLGNIDTWFVGDWAVKYDNGWGKIINGISSSSGDTIIISDFSVDNIIKIGLKQVAQDFGFFDSYMLDTEYDYIELSGATSGITAQNIINFKLYLNGEMTFSETGLQIKHSDGEIVGTDGYWNGTSWISLIN